MKTVFVAFAIEDEHQRDLLKASHCIRANHSSSLTCR